MEPSDEQIFGLVDAAVLISIGPTSKENLADYSIATLRKIGGHTYKHISSQVSSSYIVYFSHRQMERKNICDY